MRWWAASDVFKCQQSMRSVFVPLNAGEAEGE
jgi:hypothetical protein